MKSLYIVNTCIVIILISIAMIITGSFLLVTNLGWISVIGIGVILLVMSIVFIADQIDYVNTDEFIESWKKLFRRKKKEVTE